MAAPAMDEQYRSPLRPHMQLFGSNSNVNRSLQLRSAIPRKDTKMNIRFLKAGAVLALPLASIRVRWRTIL
jgi:hypothetical protein